MRQNAALCGNGLIHHCDEHFSIPSPQCFQYYYYYMVFNAVFNNISVISWRQVHLSMLSCSQSILRNIFFPSHWLLSQITIVETMDRGERNDSVAMTTINPRNEYWMCPKSNQQLPVLKSAILPTEL